MSDSCSEVMHAKKLHTNNCARGRGKPSPIYRQGKNGQEKYSGAPDQKTGMILEVRILDIQHLERAINFPLESSALDISYL